MKTANAARAAERDIKDDGVARRLVWLFIFAELLISLLGFGLVAARLIVPALLCQFVAVIAALSILSFLYARYRGFPVVQERRALLQRVPAVKTDILKANAEVMRCRNARAGIPEKRQQALAARLEELQREHVSRGMRSWLVKRANVDGIGPTLKSRLAGFDIISAADVDERIFNVPGIGEAKARALLQWRDGVFWFFDQGKPKLLTDEQVLSIEESLRDLDARLATDENTAFVQKGGLEAQLQTLTSRLGSLLPYTFGSYLLRVITSGKGLSPVVRLGVAVCAQLGIALGACLALISATVPMQAASTASSPAVASNVWQAEGIPAGVPGQTPGLISSATAAVQSVPSMVAGVASPRASTPSPTASPSSSGPMQIFFLDVGQGDATLIRAPTGEIALIDGGDANSGILQYLQHFGIARVNLMIATHPNADHIGGLVQVLSAFPVDEVVTNGQAATTLTYERFLDGVLASKAKYVEVKSGDVLQLGGINFAVLNPLAHPSSEANENSIVLRFQYGTTTFLMMGDSGAETEAKLLASGQPLKADILKVGHHGSTAGSTTRFVLAVAPTVAVYFAGLNNQYQLPAEQTLARLRNAGATVYGTGVNGSISVTVDPKHFAVTPAKILAANPAPLPVATIRSAPTVAGLEVASLTSPVRAGSNASLAIKTSPGAQCGIEVYYKYGASSAAGLYPKTADSQGGVSWTWKVGSRTSPGTWTIVVVCDRGGASQTIEIPFTVQ